VWAENGVPKILLSFRVEHGKILEIEIAADRARLKRLEVAAFSD